MPIYTFNRSTSVGKREGAKTERCARGKRVYRLLMIKENGGHRSKTANGKKKGFFMGSCSARQKE